MTTQSLTVGSITIHQQDGFYSLNDLHRASGGQAKHQPALFIRREETKALIQELSSTDSQSLKIVLGKGKTQGTYVCRELVIAYAAWISSAFHLKVLRIFLDSVQPAAAKPQPVARAFRASDDVHRRIEDVVFLMTHIQQAVTRGVLKHAVHEAVTGNTHWRGQRWLLRLADDDLGQPNLPQVTPLAADAMVVHVVAPAQGQTPAQTNAVIRSALPNKIGTV